MQFSKCNERILSSHYWKPKIFEIISKKIKFSQKIFFEAKFYGFYRRKQKKRTLLTLSRILVEIISIFVFLKNCLRYSKQPPYHDSKYFLRKPDSISLASNNLPSSSNSFSAARMAASTSSVASLSFCKFKSCYHIWHSILPLSLSFTVNIGMHLQNNLKKDFI